MRAPHVIAIVGPTAVGKSAIAEQVALTLGGEIVSADSMQVYKGLDIGTAKTPAWARKVAYHCIDLVDPGVPYSAAAFQHDARIALDEVLGRGAVPVLVGGTGLYVRAALDEMDFPVGETGTPLRATLEARAATEGAEALHAELAACDPASAALIHPNNTRRVVRALEMLREGGSYAGQAAGFSRRRFHYPYTSMVGLDMDRGELYRRIDARVDDMLARGLLDEVSSLLGSGLGSALTASQAIGYKELVPVMAGEADLADAVDRIKRSSRRYAKRQLTWFRADPRIRWLDVTDLSVADASARIIDLLESSGASTQGGST